LENNGCFGYFLADGRRKEGEGRTLVEDGLDVDVAAELGDLVGACWRN